MRIADLIRIPPVRTVVRVADLSDRKLCRDMVENFIVTGEVAFALGNILEKVGSLQGQGFFIVGNYGSGKSHLLNIISLSLGDEQAREVLREAVLENGTTGDEVLTDSVEKAALVKPLMVEISLVEHNSREYLEDIVLFRVEEKLQSRLENVSKHLQPLPPGWREKPRAQAFKVLQEALQEEGWGGLVLLLDELSEFLRSKPDSRSYNEDIRFLQYLGEFAETIPAWVIATLQENIENTGSIAGEMLHKIKDRYPVRFPLTGQHVREIVSRRLVKKEDGAEEVLSRVFEEYLRSFGTLPFSRQNFYALYPVHPLTVDLLDELRPLFSQQRGVVDFIHYRLTGDSRRGIEPFKENPAECLLTPDHIFDHFRDRIRETVETNPYSEQVFRYFEREIGNIFEDADDAATALRLVKILVLGALSPGGRRFSAEDLAAMLLYRYTELESQVNYDYIEELLEQMLRNGAYLNAEQKEDSAGDRKPSPRVYYLDLQADIAVLVKKKIEGVLGALPLIDRRTIWVLFPLLEDFFLPFSELQTAPEQDTEISWQGTKRYGKIIFSAAEDLSVGYIRELQEELAYEETDFLFCIAFPVYEDEEDRVEFSSILTQARGDFLSSLVFWAPRPITAAEEEELREAYALLVLREEYAADESPTGKRMGEHLQGLLEEKKRRVREIFKEIYLQGTLEAGSGELEPSNLGYMSFADLVKNLAGEVLKERFPRHAEIRPQGEVSGSVLQRILDQIASPQEEEAGLEKGSMMIVENCLKPLGVVKKRGRGYVLEINPRQSSLVSEFLSFLPEEGRVPLQELYRKLRKGPFGLSRESFQILGLAMTLSGAISVYQGGKRLSPSQVNYYRFAKIDEVGPGTLIRAELQKVLEDIPFLPERLRRTPLTFSAQQALWEHISSFKEDWEQKLNYLKQQIGRSGELSLFKSVDWAKIEKILQRINEFLREIKTSYTSQEGLERFLAAYQASPLLPDDFAKAEALEKYFYSDHEHMTRIGFYLQNPKLQIPEGERYEGLRQRRDLMLELLQEESLLLEEKYRERVKREFGLFVEEYGSQYVREHNRFFSPEALQTYRSIMESPAYQLLENLSRINALVVSDDFVGLNRQLSSVLARQCRQAEKPALRERPTCSCGFLLGEKVSFPMSSELEARVLRGIRQYLEALQEENTRKQLESYRKSMEQVGKRHEVTPLSKLLTMDGTKEDIVEELSSLVNRRVVDHINQALMGSAVIAERSGQKLMEMLSGRVFTYQQLQELIKSWVESESGELPSYIRIVEESAMDQGSLYYAGPAKGKRGPETVAETSFPGAKLLVEEENPELVPLMLQLGEKDFFAFSLLLGWLNLQGGFSSQVLEKVAGLLGIESGVQDLEKMEEKLSSLGEKMLGFQEFGEKAFLEQMAGYLDKKAEPAELWELFLASGIKEEKPHRFDFLLEKMAQEPFLPQILKELGRRLLRQLQAEELEGNLRVMVGSIQGTKKELSRESSSAGSEKNPYLPEKKITFLTLLEKVASCILIVVGAECMASSEPEKDGDWEKIYRGLYHFEKELDFAVELSRLESVQGDLPTGRWKNSYTASLKKLFKNFSRYLKKGKGEKRQNLEGLFMGIKRQVKKRNYGGGVYLFILDGVRLDLWEALMEEARGDFPLALLKDGFTWAQVPTVTEVQLQPLKKGSILGHIVNVNEEIISELVEDPPSLLQALDNGQRFSGEGLLSPLSALKFDFVDEKIHASREGILALQEEMLLQARRKLWPFLETVPANSLLLFAADHGFRTNMHFSGLDKEEPRYLHGDSTFFEVLAPWGLLEKGRK